MIPLLLILIFEEVGQSVTGSIIAVLGFLLFDIFAISLLLYSYFTVELVNPTERIVKAYRLWQVGWILFSIGFLLVVVLTATQIWLIFQSTQELDVNLTLAITIYRSLSSLFNSGIYFFIIFIIVGIISILYPDAVLLSHTQFARAVNLYEDAYDLEDPGHTIDELLLYIKNTKEILGDELD